MPHISVCICTFRRPRLLEALLRGLERQETEGLFTFNVIVADNDSQQSAQPVVAGLRTEVAVDVVYCAEPEQNISLARNAAVGLATGQYIAFIDDDEVPQNDWLVRLFRLCESRGVDGVLGPVLPQFGDETPAWVRRGRFYDRPRHHTGWMVRWPEARTGNVLLRRALLEGESAPFRPEFGSGGEDVDFFRRMITAGRIFLWCDEAIVYEEVPPYRCTRAFLIRRALLRGSNFPKQSGHRIRNVVKSIIAVPCYTAALPVLAVLGHHLFVRYLVKLADHTSRLIAVAGVSLIEERET